MSSSIPAMLRRVLDGLLKGSLDDRQVVALLRGSLFIAIVTAIALVAIDPAGRGFDSVPAMQETADAKLQERILSYWADGELLDRIRTYLWVDAILFAPVLALFLVTFLSHFDFLLRADATPPAFAGVRLRWKVLVSLPLLAVLASTITDAVTGYTLHFAVTPAPDFPDWLHPLLYTANRAKVMLFGVAALACLWLFTSWFFKAQDGPRNGDGDGATDASERARLRAAIADMMWRSKYVVLVLSFYGLLVLGLDQTRDALVRQIVDAGSEPQTLAGVVITLVALTLLARACWFWPRLVLRLGSHPEEAPPPRAEAFAKWWSRILGVTPFLLVDLAIAQAIHDVPAGSTGILWFVLSQAIIVLLALVFLYRVICRSDESATSIAYYGHASDAAAAGSDLGLIRVCVVWGAPTLFLLARFTGITEGAPPLALAVITAGLASWAGFLGWVAYESRKSAIPYLLGIVIIVGLFGILDWTDTHRIRAWVAGVAPFDMTALRALFSVTVILGVVSLILAWFWSRPTSSVGGRMISAFLAVAAVIAVIKLHDRDPGSPVLSDARPGIETAMGDWLLQLYGALSQRHESEDRAEAYPVFLVSTEGGGIRSAYWTASILMRMKFGIDRFDQRTFSISGVSGGALGVAAYRACGEQRDANLASMRQCVDRIGYADLWTQLLGGMLFEDVLATLVPTSLFCRNPGCGVLGRSYWFEGSMEAAVPSLALGLAGAPETRRETPHLFLTTTLVETGERAIQSDVTIEWQHFPGASDVLEMMGTDVRLSTAAHNSARFPVTNPVGALYGPNCAEDTRSPGARTKNHLCARLQDGGYFDNSSALTTADILRTLRKCLFDSACGRLKPEHAQELRKWIKPVMITIRNEERFALARGEKPHSPCAPLPDPRLDPAFPKEGEPLKFFPEVASAAVTLFNTRVAHMRFADALLERDVHELWSALELTASESVQAPCGKVSDWIGLAPIHRLNLVDDGTLYPSGWLLSKGAMEGIRKQAEHNVP